MSLRKTVLSSTILLLLALTVISCYLVAENVRSVNQIFFPMATAIVDSTDNAKEWKRVSFDSKDNLIYDSIFWDKEITNHANSESDVLLRVKDTNGNVVVDEFQVPPGKSVKLDSLKNDEKYVFEIKTTQGRNFINAT